MTAGTARRAPLLSLTAIVVMTVVQLFHASGLPLYKTLWAEDGPVFLQGGLAHTSLFETHAGYAQLAPRLLGWGAAKISLDDVAFWFAIVAAVVTALLALAVFWLSDFVVTPWLLRVVLAASFVLPPVLVQESFGNAANLQWPFLAACFWALARPSKTWLEVAVCGAIAVVTALSSSVAFVFLPIAVLLLVLRRRERLARIVPVLFVAACAAQAVISLTASVSAEQGPSNVLDLPLLYTVRVVGGVVLGERPLISAWVHLGVGIAVIVGLLIVVVVALLFLKNDRDGRWFGGAAIVTSALVFCATTYYRGTDMFSLDDGKWTPAASRYTGAALQLLIAGIVVLVARARVTPSWRRAILWVVVAQALVVPAITWRPETPRSHNVTWRGELARARRECMRPGVGSVPIPITPEPKVWNVVILCSDLR